MLKLTIHSFSSSASIIAVRIFAVRSCRCNRALYFLPNLPLSPSSYLVYHAILYVAGSFTRCRFHVLINSLNAKVAIIKKAANWWSTHLNSSTSQSNLQLFIAWPPCIIVQKSVFRAYLNKLFLACKLNEIAVAQAKCYWLKSYLIYNDQIRQASVTNRAVYYLKQNGNSGRLAKAAEDFSLTFALRHFSGQIFRGAKANRSHRDWKTGNYFGL